MKLSQVLAGMLAGACLVVSARAGGLIDWKTTRAQAVAEAQASGKRILLLAGRNTCPNTMFMKSNMCERASIRQVLDSAYVGWYCIVDSSAEWTAYSGGLGAFTLPLICIIDPNDSLHYLDRTTGPQADEPAFRNRLVSQASGVDAFEPDNSASAAKLIGNTQVQNRSIHVAGDPDWAKLVIGGIGAQNARLETAGPVGGDTQMWLYKGSNGQQLGYDDDSGTDAFSRVTIGALTPGTYFIKITEYNNNGTIPSYTLRANWATQYGLIDAYESDNFASAAKPIAKSQTQNRSIHAAGNVDWAKFVVPAPGTSGAVVLTAGAAGDTELWLLRGNGAQVAYDDDSGAGSFSRVATGPLTPGTYYIKVQEKGNNGTIPAYTLRAYWP